MTAHHSGLTLDDIMQYNVNVNNTRQKYKNIINNDIFRRN